MEQVENLMVADFLWDDNEPPETVRKLNGPGYREIGTDVFVPMEDAFDYALEHCVKVVPQGFRDIEWTQEFKEMLVERFYSGNWIEE